MQLSWTPNTTLSTVDPIRPGTRLALRSGHVALRGLRENLRSTYDQILWAKDHEEPETRAYLDRIADRMEIDRRTISSTQRYLELAIAFVHGNRTYRSLEPFTHVKIDELRLASVIASIAVHPRFLDLGDIAARDVLRPRGVVAEFLEWIMEPSPGRSSLPRSSELRKRLRKPSKTWTEYTSTMDIAPAERPLPRGRRGARKLAMRRAMGRS